MIEIGSREDAAHTAVINFSYEVHENLPSGELRGTPVKKGRHTFRVTGADRNICIRKLNELIRELSK